jgi:diadenosine tetraphosphatase ApaH/serine/threonine PP2A family protein phosphatase
LYQRLRPQQPHAGRLCVHWYVEEHARLWGESPIWQAAGGGALAAVRHTVLQVMADEEVS